MPGRIEFFYSTNDFSVALTAYNGFGGNVTIPDAVGEKPVTSIGAYAFYRYPGVTSVFIPSSVTNIGPCALSDCIDLMDITVDLLNSNFASLDGILFNKTKTTLIQYPAGRIGDYSIPAGVTCIGHGAFDGATNLTSVTIPDGVTNIEDRAFQYCGALKSLTIPNSVTSISNWAFTGCTGLTSVYFERNAPIAVPTNLFYRASNVTVYYRAGTTGWGNTFAGQPTALWLEQPTYQEWAQTVGLLDKFPNASAETDDADQDGMSNLAEMQAGTDPTSPNSKLAFESAARLNDLADEDKSAVGPEQHAFYFQTVPGKKYELQSATAIAGVWQTETNITATTTQKRVLVPKPVDQGFYRLILIP
jgi:hypothetical protein